MRDPLTITEGERLRADAAAARLGDALAAGAHTPHIAGLATPPATSRLLEVGPDGARVGAYAGALRLDGRDFALEPRIGWSALEGWVAAATGLRVPAPDHPGERARVAAMVSVLWVRAVDDASRHGPPSFRRDVAHEGSSVRGQLDVRKTVRLRAKGSSAAASVYRARELDNPVTRIIVAAERVLARDLGAARWRTDRVEQVLAQLHTAVGRRTPSPADGELQRMRYTPITRPFKWVAELSARIVRQDPLATSVLPGRVQGLVLDLDDLYGAATLRWVRAARPDLLADKVGRGSIALRDRRGICATVELLPDRASGGAPAVAVVTAGGRPHRLDLCADAGEAELMLRHVLSTAGGADASRQVSPLAVVPRA